MFSIGDVVDVPSQPHRTVYGTISNLLPNKKALVHFKMPRDAKLHGFCDGCGRPGALSVNGGTGEIECMHTGCGHCHGFSESDEIIPLSQLVNITTKKMISKKIEFREQLTALLHEGITKKVLTVEQRYQILKGR